MTKPKTFLVADPNFSNPKSADKFSISVDTYNSTIINNMLAARTSPEDCFLFFGDITSGTAEELEQLLAPLNPTQTCDIIDGREQTHFSQDAYKHIFRQVWNAPGICRGSFNNDFYTVLISPAKRGIKYDLEQIDDYTFVATAASKYPMDTIYKDGVLNCSLGYHSLIPINTTDLPMIIAERKK